MKNKWGIVKLILFFVLLLVIFVAVISFTAKKTFDEKKAAEKFTEVDYYSMQSYSDTNVKLVMDALKSGKTDKLKKKMLNSDGLEEVMAFADWSNADFDNVLSLGTGSLSPRPDAEGRMDMSERFFVDIGDSRYVLFVETLTYRWGRSEEGISAISVTTFNHFDNLWFAWNGKDDDESACAGKLFWPGNQPEGTDPDY